MTSAFEEDRGVESNAVSDATDLKDQIVDHGRARTDHGIRRSLLMGRQRL
jgi:hypothetical protein